MNRVSMVTVRPLRMQAIANRALKHYERKNITFLKGVVTLEPIGHWGVVQTSRGLFALDRNGFGYNSPISGNSPLSIRVFRIYQDGYREADVTIEVPKLLSGWMPIGIPVIGVPVGFPNLWIYKIMKPWVVSLAEFINIRDDKNSEFFDRHFQKWHDLLSPIVLPWTLPCRTGITVNFDDPTDDVPPIIRPLGKRSLRGSRRDPAILRERGG